MTTTQPSTQFQLGGKPYRIEPTYAMMRRLRAAGLDLLTAFDAEAFVKLQSDLAGLVECLWGVTSDQAAQYGLTRETWEAQLDSQAIEDGTAALLEAIVLFFPPGKRATLQRSLELVRAADQRLQEETKIRLDRVEQHLPQLVTDALARADSRSNGSSASSPASAELTPTS